MNYQENKKPASIKENQLDSFSCGEWGQEECIVNNKNYCGKRMLVNKSFFCSMHYHKIKEETFYLVSGKILFETESGGKRNNRVMTPGDVQHMTPGIWHKFTVLENAEILEFSTFHMNSYSYCKEPGEQIKWNKIRPD